MSKSFKNIKPETVLGIVGLVFLVYVLYNYSQNKSIFKSGMAPLNAGSTVDAPLTNDPNVMSNLYAPDNGTVAGSSPMQSQVAAANPSDLLPSDGNNGWANANPVGSPNLQSISLLNPQQIVGINTQGSTLRNANQQLRSEPANPRSSTGCPWNISTIEPDPYRLPLEVGSA